MSLDYPECVFLVGAMSPYDVFIFQMDQLLDGSIGGSHHVVIHLLDSEIYIYHSIQ